MKKEMLINVLQPEECRIAIVEDGVLEELYVERTSQESYVGNIYKGRVVNIEPSIQAAFIDFGIGRNGFLHVSDVDPAYYRHLEMDRGSGSREARGGRRGRDDRPARSEPRRRSESAPAPSASPAAPAEEHVFGAGLFDEPPSGTEAESRAETAPGDADNEDRRHHRQRRRGRGGRRKAGPAGDAAGESPEPRDEPPTMESVERRTEDDDPSFAGSLEPGGGGFDEPADAPSADVEEFGESAEEAELDSAAEPDLIDENGGRGDRRRGRGPRRGGREGGWRRLGRDGDGRPKPPIQEIFRRGQEVLVQVIKEGIGTKGPTLSTYISIAGRYLVLMPGLNRVGVSRKIVDEEQRRRLKEIVSELEPPKGVGFIIRTAGVDRNKKELQSDLAYLLRIWQVVVRRIRKQKAPAAIYQESDMITRTIRDTFTSDIDTVWVDHPDAFAHAQEFLQAVMPRYANRIRHYDSTEPLFYRYGIEDEIARIHQKKLPLPHGGSIVIEQTEALVAIDVNSGSFRADNNAEATAFQMNLHAAREIARQLRLRDLGGVIINDFIDMRDEHHRREVEKTLREAVKRDRARTKVLRISQFGIIEMTRQRIRPSLRRSVFQDCPFCRGNGHVKTVESMGIDVMRILLFADHRDAVARIEVRVHDNVADYLLNRKRGEIHKLEESGKMQVVVEGVPNAPPETFEFVCFDNQNNEVRLFPPEPAPRSHRSERR